jgi:predicted DNA-binding protein
MLYAGDHHTALISYGNRLDERHAELSAAGAEGWILAAIEEGIEDTHDLVFGDSDLENLKSPMA